MLTYVITHLSQQQLLHQNYKQFLRISLELVFWINKIKILLVFFIIHIINQKKSLKSTLTKVQVKWFITLTSNLKS